MDIDLDIDLKGIDKEIYLGITNVNTDINVTMS